MVSKRVNGKLMLVMFAFWSEGGVQDNGICFFFSVECACEKAY